MKFTLYMEIYISRAIIGDSMKLAFGNIVDPFWVVATLVMEKGIASSGLDNIFCVYSWTIMTKL